MQKKNMYKDCLVQVLIFFFYFSSIFTTECAETTNSSRVDLYILYNYNKKKEIGKYWIPKELLTSMIFNKFFFCTLMTQRTLSMHCYIDSSADRSGRVATQRRSMTGLLCFQFNYYSLFQNSIIKYCIIAFYSSRKLM